MRVVDADKLIYSKELISKVRQINIKQRFTIGLHFTIPDCIDAKRPLVGALV